MPVAGLLRGVAIDIACWYFLPLAFLVIYVGVLGQPASAVLPHLLVMALLFAFQAILRLVVSRGVSHSGLRLAISSLMLALFVDAMLTYYVLVVIGVHFWGGVIAWPAIPTVLRQAPDIVESVGVPPLAALVVVIILMTSVLAACRFYLKRFDWTQGLGQSAWLKAVGAAAAFGVLWLQVASATEAPWITDREPLSMSLFPLGGTRDIDGHRVTAEEASARDAVDNQARAQYVPAAGGSRPNVILIVVDAMRPGNMSLFGYERETTPYLDSLERAGAIRKFIAHTSCSDTACGLISLSTSRPPRDFSFHPFGLHEALRRHGYRIHVIQSGTYLHPMKGYYG
jgi:glucan phosphoethanolaminetransferase (alkaline phosphatase superfamily)